MSFIKFAVVALATTSLVAAGPIARDVTGPTYGEIVAQCGNNQTLSCCNQQKTDNEANSALFGVGSFAGNLLGGACSQLSIPSGIGGSVPFNNACGDNVAACCTGDESGALFNVECNPVSFF